MQPPWAATLAEALAAVRAAAADPDAPLFAAGEAVAFSPWERRQVATWAAGGAPLAGRPLAEAIALEMVVADRRRRLAVEMAEADGGADAEAAELASLLDNGRRVSAQLRHAVTELSAGNRSHDAAQAALRSAALSEALAWLNATIDRLAAARVEADRLPPEATPASARRERRRTSAMVALLVFLAGVLLVIVHTSGRPAPIPAFTLDDFAELPAVTAVVARPPSLYLTVDEAAWSGLDDAARTRLTEAVADRLEPAGYSGAILRTPTGMVVAEWLRESGVRLRRVPPPGAPPT